MPDTSWVNYTRVRLSYKQQQAHSLLSIMRSSGYNDVLYRINPCSFRRQTEQLDLSQLNPILCRLIAVNARTTSHHNLSKTSGQHIEAVAINFQIKDIIANARSVAPSAPLKSPEEFKPKQLLEFPKTPNRAYNCFRASLDCFFPLDKLSNLEHKASNLKQLNISGFTARSCRRHSSCQ